MTTDPTEETQPPRTASTDDDPIMDLTMAELDAGSRLIRCDLMAASQQGHYLRPAAMAVTAYILAKRDDPKVKLSKFRAMTLTQLAEALGYEDDDQPAEEDETEEDEDALADRLLAPDVDDTPPPPRHPDAELEDELAARPTDSRPGSSSPAPGESAPPPSVT